jgi:CheY-like chemotaxis protein
MIKISSLRLTDTINNYMDIAILVTGNYKLKTVSVNLFSLFHTVFDRFIIPCQTKKVLFEADVNEDYHGILVMADKDLLEKVINHFLDNAVKFTSQGKIRTGFFIREQKIRFFFSDTGVGIAKGAQQRIFETFMQEDISHSRGFEGSGLGLSICNEAVKLMGGTISVESEKGKGSLFLFDIPLVIPKYQQSVLETSHKISQHGIPHILIAEDELANALYLQKSLKKEGFEITVVQNGREAVDFCKLNPHISVVLMDIKMPVMDGYEATKLIRTFRKELPIIGVSAYDLYDDQQKALEAGCNDYIPKPVNRDLLLRILSRFLS